MKFTIFLFLMIGFAACAQNQNKKTRITNGETYECVLLDTHESRLSCGILALAYGMRFSVNTNDKEIAVVIRCPDTYEDGFFLKGGKYKIALTSDSSVCKDYRIYNDYKDSLPTYYALNV